MTKIHTVSAASPGPPAAGPSASDGTQVGCPSLLVEALNWAPGDPSAMAARLDAALASLHPVGVLLVLSSSIHAPPALAFDTARFHRVPAVPLAGDRDNERATQSDDAVQLLQHRGAPPPTDLRDLPAPEPLQHYLDAAARLQPGGAFVAQLPRRPRMLLPQLEARGLPYQLRELSDASALVGCWRPL